MFNRAIKRCRSAQKMFFAKQRTETLPTDNNKALKAIFAVSKRRRVQLAAPANRTSIVDDCGGYGKRPFSNPMPRVSMQQGRCCASSRPKQVTLTHPSREIPPFTIRRLLFGRNVTVSQAARRSPPTISLIFSFLWNWNVLLRPDCGLVWHGCLFGVLDHARRILAFRFLGLHFKCQLNPYLLVCGSIPNFRLQFDSLLPKVKRLNP